MRKGFKQSIAIFLTVATIAGLFPNVVISARYDSIHTDEAFSDEFLSGPESTWNMTNEDNKEIKDNEYTVVTYENPGFAGGLGTESSPYQIENKQQLELLRDYVNNQEESYNAAYYVLTRDIDLNPGKWHFSINGDIEFTDGAEQWISISNNFSGSFDGTEHEISGLYINSTEDNQGLFGSVTGAVIRNLHVSGNIYSTGDYIGGIVGHTNSSLISGFSNYKGTHISNCVFEGNVTGKTAGGIAGYLSHWNTSITGCINKGRISASCSGAYVGGIVGSMYNCSISNSMNFGEISSDYSSTYAAGIAGKIIGQGQGSAQPSGASSIRYCQNAGNITGNTVAGIAADVTGGSASNVGGVTISNCANCGNIISSSTAYAILGTIHSTATASYNRMYLTFEKCYNTGDLEGLGADFIGYISYVKSTISANSFSLTSIASDIGKRLTVKQMREQSSYTDWSFSSGWATNPKINNGYPYIRSMESALKDNSGQLKVLMPTDIENYTGLYFYLSDKNTGETSKTYITDNTEYVLARTRNGVYDLKIVSPNGMVYYESGDIVFDEDGMELDLSDIKPPCAQSVSVYTPTGRLTEGYSVNWYNKNEKNIAHGNSVTLICPGEKLYYDVILDDNLLKKYNIPERQSVIAGENSNVNLYLTERSKISISGTVKNGDELISDAYVNITQKITDRLYDTVVVKTNERGKFSAEILSAGIEVNVYKDGYADSKVSYRNLSDGADISLEILPLSNKRIALSVYAQSAVRQGESAIYDDEFSTDNLDISVYNNTANTEITDFTYSKSTIYLPADTENESNLTITAHDLSNKHAEASENVIFGDNCVVRLNMIELGGFSLQAKSSSNTNNVVSVYDSEDKLVNIHRLDRLRADSDGLADGKYTLIIMGESTMFNALSCLNDYSKFGLTEGEDYLTETIDIKNGIITEVSVNAIPKFNESDFGYLDADKTAVSINKTTVSPGGNVIVKMQYAVKEEKADDIAVSSINIDIPDNCSIIEGSVTLDGEIVSGYTVKNGVFSLSTSKKNSVLRLCIIPNTTGSFALTAYAGFTYSSESLVQAVGSVGFDMQETTLSLPKKTAYANLTASGIATPGAYVELYDNGILVGSSSASKSGRFTVPFNLIDPDNIKEHDIYAKIIADAVEIKSSVQKVIYDEHYTEATRIDMTYLGNRMTFDLLNPSGVTPGYSFAPSKPNFSFAVYFEGADTSLVNNVFIVTKGADGAITKVPMTRTGNSVYVGTYDYTSSTCPRSVGVTYSVGYDVIHLSGTADSASQYLKDNTYSPDKKTVEAEKPYEGMNYELIDVSPNRSSNGKITLKIKGNLLKANMTAALSNGYVAVSAEKIYWFNHQYAYATFDMANVPDDIYSMVVNCDGVITELSDCFTVDSALAKGELETKINIGTDIKKGEEYKGSVTFTNTGYTDVKAPIASIYGNNVQFKTEDSFSESVTEFARNQEGIAGIIGPGETAAINFAYRAEDDGDFDVKIMTLDQIRSSLFDEINADSDSEVETVVLSNMADLSGRTTDDYMQRTQERANVLDMLGVENITYSNLESLDYYNANGMLGMDILTAATDIGSVEMDFSRSYSSAISDRYSVGELGYGWSSDYSVKAEYVTDTESKDEYIIVTAPDKFIVLVRDGDGFVEPSSGYYSAEIKNNCITVSYKDGSGLDFNSDGTLNRIYDINGNYTECKYKDGNLIRVSTSNGDELIFEYEDNKIVRVVSALTGDSVDYSYTHDYLTDVTTKYGTTSYTYDAESIGGKRHSLTGVVFEDGTYVSYTYDEYGRLIALTDSDGTVSLEYGDYNNVTITDEVGNKSCVYYDYIGNAVRTIDSNGNVTTAGYGYITQPESISEGFFNNYSYSYNDKHEITSITDNDGNSVNYTYDSMGNVASVTDKRGIDTVYERDNKGQTTAIVYADGSSESYSYDEKGNIDSITKRSGIMINYTYDSFDRLVKEEYSTGDIKEYKYDSRGDITSISENGDVTAIEYDSRGDLSKVIYPDGKVILYTYDSVGRMTSVTDNKGNTTSYTYDNSSRIASVSNGDISSSYKYNAAGGLKKQTNSNGTYTDYEYENGLLKSISNKGADGSVISFFEYTYDEYGYISSMTDSDGIWYYEYDKSGQLIRAESPAGDVTEYTYDLSDNRVSVTINGETIGYTANDLNQYVEVNGNTLDYDADGNLISDAEGGLYEYDYLDRLIKFTSNDGVVYEYGYDAFGNRNRVTVNGETTEYLNTPTGYGYAIAEYSDDNVRQYVQGIGLSAVIDSGESYLYSFNHLGSTSEITDINGGVVNSYKYNADGKVTERNEGITNPFTYVGEYGIADDNNGLYYVRARYVSQDTGSFINADPLGQYADLNVYRYAENNQVNNVDLSGQTSRIALKRRQHQAAKRYVQRKSEQLNNYVDGLKNPTSSGIDDIIGFFAEFEQSYVEWAEQMQENKETAQARAKDNQKQFYKELEKMNEQKGPKISNPTPVTISAPKGWYKYHDVGAVRGEYKLFFNENGSLIKRKDWLPGIGYYIPKTTNISSYPSEAKYQSINASIDPSGYIYEAVGSNRVEGVTATIFYKESKDTDDEFAELWDASEYNQENPLITDSDGKYAWDVPDGWWQVRYEKEGYDTVYSDWLPVPPPQTDINIGIVSMSAPKVLECVKIENGFWIKFSQYMSIDSVNCDNVYIIDGGSKIQGAITPIDAEIAGDKELAETGVQYAREFTITSEEELSDDAGIYIDNVYNYAGTVISSACNATTGLSISESEITLQKGFTKQLHVTLNSGDNIRTLTWSSADENIAMVSTDGTVTAVEEGSTFVFAKASTGKSAYCAVNVIGESTAVESVMFDKTEIEMHPEDFVQICAAVLPEDADDKTLVWRSSDKNAAIVSKNGFVTAVSPGTTTITAASANGICCECIVDVISKVDMSVLRERITNTEYSCELYFAGPFEEKTAIAIIAFYDKENKLVQAKTAYVDIEPGRVKLNIDVENKPYRTYKLMLWDGLDTIKPLTKYNGV